MRAKCELFAENKMILEAEKMKIDEAKKRRAMERDCSKSMVTYGQCF